MEQEFAQVLVKLIPSGDLVAFDDIWRGSKSPRIKSRSEAIRLLIADTIARGSFKARANG